MLNRRVVRIVFCGEKRSVLRKTVVFTEDCVVFVAVVRKKGSFMDGTGIKSG